VTSAADFLAQILDGAPQPIWVVDEDGHIVFANPAAVAALGYDQGAQLHGQASHALVHHKRPDGSPYPEAECPMLRPRQSGETAHGEDEWFIRADGSMFPIAWWSAPIAMTRGNGAVLAFTDISERRAGERAIREREAAEIRAAESQAAQRRIVENAAAARRQIARDLHDGAQQRLITMLISIQLAREEIGGDPGQARHLLDDAVSEARRAIGELRELAAGVHPPILAARGLVAAVEDLAHRAVLPVTVSGSLQSRLPEPVEAHAYFLVAEALTNSMKHARATSVSVMIEIEDGALSVVVRDDGIGGAGIDGAGSGLAGLADRVSALGGRLDVVSPAGRGTTIRARLPLGSSGG
jgi:PAS domain S-box-containing protein